VGEDDVVVVDWWGASNYAKLPATSENRKMARADGDDQPRGPLTG